MQTYQRKPHAPKAAPRAVRAVPQQDPLQSVTSLSSVEQGARRVDLPAAIQSKMEEAFGADLSGVNTWQVIPY